MVKVSIIIKTLNEEENIRGAIESSLAAVEAEGDIVIADSASTDRTIKIAKEFPVTIVQIENPAERSCGVGPQLGYQYSSGEYIYILDGDMELKGAFLRRAIEILDKESDVAGVGGYIHEMRVEHLEVQGQINRIRRLGRKRQAEVQCLNGGGLYRRSAIEDVGYFSDRNLHAFEEYDLGARLRSKGWRLVKLEERAVDHYSYVMNTWRLLWHRIRSGRFTSSGQLLSRRDSRQLFQKGDSGGSDNSNCDRCLDLLGIRVFGSFLAFRNRANNYVIFAFCVGSIACYVTTPSITEAWPVQCAHVAYRCGRIFNRPIELASAARGIGFTLKF